MLDKVSLRAAQAALQSDLPICFNDVDYSAGTVAILRGIDLEIHAGEPMILLGPNGPGKTTLLKLAMGLISPRAGRSTYGGRRNPPPGRRAAAFRQPM